MRRSSSPCIAATKPVNTRKTNIPRNPLIISNFSKPGLNSDSKFPERSMTLPIPVNTSQPMSEIKQNKTKRLSWKVRSKIPRFSRTPSTQSQKSELIESDDGFVNNRGNLNNTLSSSPSNLTSNSKRIASENEESNAKLNSDDMEHITSKTNRNFVKVYDSDLSGKPGTSKSTDTRNNNSAPSLISNLEKMSKSTTKTQKKNVKASSSKTLPRNFWNFISKKNKPPELVTTPSLSINQFSYSSPPPTIPEKAPRKKRGSRPISGNFSLTKQTLINVMLRKGRNRTSSEDSLANNENEHPVLIYESFPDPDPEDFVNVNFWDLPDSISATEDAGGVLQMIEYDGIYINGVKVN
ncbi:17107_t:CDS:1 [Acaulospora morrowiae]|uniref:17107_t:CDS:1 n=1 Tax=Acaulospora morrowiae TaxID=94023 RepID=A0A9N8ZNC6_9GLOM|nr:17107_t:CDS:1 [Acaulospora morrowiae]